MKKRKIMKTREQKAKELVLGILASFGLWIVGMLMSGTLAGGDVLELYDTGFLIWLFPITVGIVFVLTSVKCAKSKSLFYISMLISFFVPFLCWGLSIVLSIIDAAFIKHFGHSAVYDFIIQFFNIISFGGLLPATSVVFGFFDDIGYIAEWWKNFLLPIAFFSPGIIGICCSIIIHIKKERKNKSLLLFYLCFC